jgi:hypothetical protein
VLAAVRLLRTDDEVDRCMRELEGCADNAAGRAPVAHDDRPDTDRAAAECGASVGLLRRHDSREDCDGGGDELWSH